MIQFFFRGPFSNDFLIAGAGHNEKIIGTYPGYFANFWWNTLVPRWEDYKISSVSEWKPVGWFIGLLKSFLVL